MLPFFSLFSEIKIFVLQLFLTYSFHFVSFCSFLWMFCLKKGKRTVGNGGSCKMNHGDKNLDIQFCKLLFKITVTIKFTFNLMIMVERKYNFH